MQACATSTRRSMAIRKSRADPVTRGPLPCAGSAAETSGSKTSGSDQTLPQRSARGAKRTRTAGACRQRKVPAARERCQPIFETAAHPSRRRKDRPSNDAVRPGLSSLFEGGARLATFGLTVAPPSQSADTPVQATSVDGLAASFFLHCTDEGWPDRGLGRKSDRAGRVSASTHGRRAGQDPEQVARWATSRAIVSSECVPAMVQALIRRLDEPLPEAPAPE